MLICETKMLTFGVKFLKIMQKKEQVYINNLERFELFSFYTSVVVEVAKDCPK